MNYWIWTQIWLFKLPIWIQMQFTWSFQIILQVCVGFWVEWIWFLKRNLNIPKFWNIQISCPIWNALDRCSNSNTSKVELRLFLTFQTSAWKYPVVLDANAQIVLLPFSRVYSSDYYTCWVWIRFAWGVKRKSLVLHARIVPFPA
jgi:hypothetical protein